MKVSKFKFVALVSVVAMILIIGIVYIDILKIKSHLDELYWVAENTHSGMVSTAIRRTELMLNQRLTVLKLLVVSTTILGIVSLFWSFSSHVSKASQTGTIFIIIYLVFVLLIPAVNSPFVNATTHHYARVEMDVPSGSHFTDVDGYFTSKPVGIFDLWVCYHIGVYFPTSYEWVAGGYYTDINMGTVFYVEWVIDGEYSEITATNISIGKQYHIDVYKHTGGGVGPPPPEGWGASIYDPNSWFLMLRKSNLDLPTDDPQMVAVAGGESVNPDNPMRALFSELMWKTYHPDDYPDIGEDGYWDGNKFACSTIEDDPYSVTMNTPYYDFSVSGGNGRTLIIKDSNGGTTAPPAGFYVYSPGTSVTVTASVLNQAYVFDYWLLDGNNVGSTNPISITMNSDHTLEPCFRYIGSGVGGGDGGGSCKAIPCPY